MGWEDQKPKAEAKVSKKVQESLIGSGPSGVIKVEVIGHISGGSSIPPPDE
jgi:hypothetical protein